MNVAIIGRRGLGKSTLAQKIAEDLSDNVIVFDANNQFRNAEYRTSDIEKVKSLLESSGKWGEKKHLYLAFVPQGDIETEWDRFADVIWKYGDYSLIIDEAHRLQKPQYVNQKLDRMMRQAPRRERNDENPVDIIQCFHRPVDMNGIVLSLLDYVYLFRITKKRDLEYVEKEFEPGVAEAVADLRTPPPQDARDVLRVNVESGDFLIITDSKSWFRSIRQPIKQESPFQLFAVN